MPIPAWAPVLEAMVNGKYYWIPFSRLASIVIEAPADLRDRVWLPATCPSPMAARPSR